MAKNKLYSVDKSLNEMTDFLSEYLNSTVLDKPVEYMTKHTKDEYVFSAVIDYGEFKAKINFSPSAHILANFLDLKLVYPDSPYEYSIFDVFNLFDIQDFKQYYVEDATTKTELKEGIDELLETIEKYRYDIKKAGEPDNLLRLKENFETDWNSVTDNNSEWKDELENDELFLDLVHPYFTNASDNKTEKIHSRLKKAAEKGRLDTIYEKRLLKYLDSGNKFETDFQHNPSASDREYRKLRMKITLCLFTICVVICIAAVFIGEKIAFGDYTIIRHYVNLNGMNILPNEVFGAFAAGLIISVVANVLFVKRLVVKFAPDDKKTYYLEKYEKDVKDNQSILNKYKPVRIIAGVILTALAIFVIFFSINTRFAEKGDKVKYVGGVDAGISTISKSDLVIYKVEGYYNEDENGKNSFEKYDSPSYLITDSKGNYFEFDNAYKGSEYERFILSLSSDYSKEITNVKAIEDVKEIKR